MCQSCCAQAGSHTQQECRVLLRVASIWSAHVAHVSRGVDKANYWCMCCDASVRRMQTKRPPWRPRCVLSGMGRAAWPQRGARTWRISEAVSVSCSNKASARQCKSASFAFCRTQEQCP